MLEAEESPTQLECSCKDHFASLAVVLFTTDEIVGKQAVPIVCVLCYVIIQSL